MHVITILSFVLSFVIIFAKQNKKSIESNNAVVPNITELSDTHTLKIVFVVMRNGYYFPDNYMIRTNPSYEWKHLRFPRGELNKKGRVTMYDAGNKLRKLYSKFLKREYITKHQIKVTAVGNMYTTNTRESALLVKAGIRNKNKNQSIRKKWSIRKMATTRNDEFTDAASDYYMRCPKYWLEQNKILNNSFAGILKTKYGNLYNALRKNTASNLTDHHLTILHDLFELYETSYYSKFGKPKWLKGDLFNQFYFAMNDYVNISFSTNYLKKVTGGRMLKYFFDRMDDKLNHGHSFELSDTKMLVHVGYDASVSPFFAALGGSDGFTRYSNGNIVKSFRPSQAGMVIIEGHQLDQNKDFWLRIFTSESLAAPIYELKKVNCTFPCSFNNLKSLLNDVSVDKNQWVNECKIESK